MTVKELIAELERDNPNAEVVLEIHYPIEKTCTGHATYLDTDKEDKHVYIIGNY